MLTQQEANKIQKHNVVYTVTANCQDCYRCVRVCPVKAIRVKDGQACIDDKLCISCGTCVKECPQHAKTIISSLDEVKALLASSKVAVTVAPAFACFFDGWKSGRIPSALRQLGFDYVSETAEGAKVITEKSVSPAVNGNVCTACPAVVSYVEKYRPQFLDYLIPIVSPMIAHGKLLKQRLGTDWKVVFIGPCAAKKFEAQRPENQGVIDAVLTFDELTAWMNEENIDLSTCLDSNFESFGDLSSARLFPLSGGLIKTAGIHYDPSVYDVVETSGPDNVVAIFNLPEKDWKFKIVEPLFCKLGCINGPGINSDKNILTRRQDLIKYAAQAENDLTDQAEIDCTAQFSNQNIAYTVKAADESKIHKILELTGKADPKLQLNCGACGYKTCRDNAIAVMHGMAEPEMCIPYTRRLAEQRTDKIIETSPNGIVVLDENLNIIKMNPAFQNMFMCNNNILGKHISYLVDAVGFEKLAADTVEEYESIQKKYGIKYHEIVYALRTEKQYVGIYMDLSNIKFADKQIDLMKDQTIMHAKELLDHQIKFAQEMAHYLGKSTAQSEELVKRLMNIYEEDE